MSTARDSHDVARVFLRPIGSPLPLGFLALAAGAFALSGLQLSWIPTSQWNTIGLAILAFVVPLQALSCIFGYLARDSAAGTGMAVQGGGWLAIGLITYTGVPGKTSGALGLILIGAAAALLVPVVTSALGKMLASLVMALTSLRFFLTAAYELSSASNWKVAAAITGLVLAAVALYAALAFELEDTRKSTVLPTLRRASGRKAITGSLADEISAVYREAGVRQRL